MVSLAPKPVVLVIMELAFCLSIVPVFLDRLADSWSLSAVVD